MDPEQFIFGKKNPLPLEDAPPRRAVRRKPAEQAVPQPEKRTRQQREPEEEPPTDSAPKRARRVAAKPAKFVPSQQELPRKALSANAQSRGNARARAGVRIVPA